MLGVIVRDHAVIVPISTEASSMIFSVQVPLPALLSKPESGLVGLKLALVRHPRTKRLDCRAEEEERRILW